MSEPKASPLRVHCPLCKSRLQTTSDQIGTTITCDNCLEEFVIEAPRRGPAAGPPDPPLPLEFPPVALPDEIVPGAPPENPGSVPDELWLAPDEAPETGLFDPVGGSVPADAESSDDYEFTVVCPLCSTRLGVTRDRIGQQIRCPDCYSEFLVRTPPRHARRARTAPEAAGDDGELRLRDVVPPPVVPPSVPPSEGPGRGPAGVPPPGEPVRDFSHAALAAEAIRKAEAELEEAERLAPKVPAAPLTSGMISFLLDVHVVPRLIGLALGLQLEVYAVRWAAVHMSSANPLIKFAAGISFAFILVFGVAYFAAAAVSLLAIAQDTAAGNERVTHWPEIHLIDWLLESLHLVTALFVGILPGLLLGQVFAVFGWTVYGAGLTVACLLSVWTFFPVLLTATLETGMPFNFFSPPVFRSLALCRASWIRFLLISGVLFSAGGLVWQLHRLDSWPLHLLASLTVIALAMTYFRMLGRLVLVCEQPEPHAASTEEVGKA